MTQINQNLFFTLIAAATTAFLGLLVFIHNRKGISNRIFIVHAAVGVVWAIINYFSVIASPETALFWIRFVIFFAVPHVFLFLLFVENFPSEKLEGRRWQFVVTLGLMGLMMILALSPFVFSGISITETGGVVPSPGILIPVFSPLLVVFFIASVFLVVKKYFTTYDAVVKRQWLVISIGLFVAYTLLIFFVFLRVITLNDTTFVPYSPLFLLPIFIGAAYAILRHHLFRIKVIASETLTFLLLITSVIGVMITTTTFGLVLSLVTVLFVLVFGILLIKSVLREVEQRELLEKLNKELAEQKGQVEELSHFKSQLLSLASHQIKAPLAAIKGFVSILLEGLYGKVGNPKVVDTLGKIKGSADDLIDLIDTLLDLRRIDEGKMEYQFAKVDFGKMVKDVVQGLEPLALEKKLSLEATVPARETLVNADAQKLKQVVRNLVDNAIKYTQAGFVKIELHDGPSALDGQEHDEMIVSVKDTGLGVSPMLLPHLFEEFIRDDRVKKEIRGTGLGLYIARKILEAHGGTIWAESSGEGKGSTFFVKLKKL